MRIQLHICLLLLLLLLLPVAPVLHVLPLTLLLLMADGCNQATAAIRQHRQRTCGQPGRGEDPDRGRLVSPGAPLQQKQPNGAGHLVGRRGAEIGMPLLKLLPQVLDAPSPRTRRASGKADVDARATTSQQHLEDPFERGDTRATGRATLVELCCSAVPRRAVPDIDSRPLVLENRGLGCPADAPLFLLLQSFSFERRQVVEATS